MTKTLIEYWHSYKEWVKKRVERGEPEFPTGIKFLDTLTDGPQRGQIWTIAGKSGSGKTSLALGIGRNISDHKKTVMFISLEMKGEELVARMFCDMMKWDYDKLRIGDTNVQREQTFVNFLGGIDFEVMEYGYTFDEIEKVIQETYPKGKKPDVIIIDFVQLIETKYDQRVDMEKYMRKLTELAKTENMAIILVSQIRRFPSGSDINREPGMSDLKGTGMIEQMSYAVIIIYKWEELGRIHYALKVVKNRGGACGSKEVNFIGSQYRFEEYEEV